MSFLELNKRFTFIAWFMIPFVVLSYHYHLDIIQTVEYLLLFIACMFYVVISVLFMQATTIRHLIALRMLKGAKK